MSRLAAVTGATGFLGRHALEALVAEGWRLRLLVRRDPRLELGPEPVDLIPGDLNDRAALGRLVDGADAVIHLAGAIKAVDRAAFMRVNRDGTAALADAVDSRAPSARFVLVSSLAAREPDLSHYAASKRAAEHVVPSFAHILRPTAIYGPGDRETLALFKTARFALHPLLGTATARITLVHARDVARAIVAAIDAPPGCSEVTDSQPEGYLWTDVMAAACAAVGTRRRAFHLPQPVLRLVGRLGDTATALTGNAEMVTSAKVREILHPDWSSTSEVQLPAHLWQPEFGIDAGFSETVAWYRAEGWII